MHFSDTGTGIPLVLLPAFPFDSRLWDRARTGLAEYARVITPDPRGFGRTPLDDAEPDLAVVAADVVALLDRLSLDRVVLGGCSMGGYVAMAVLRLAPERVGGLVLIDTRPAADVQQAKENRYAMAERAEREGVAGWLADQMLPVLLGPTTLERRPDVVDTVRRLLEEAPPASVAWAQRAMAARPDSSATLREAGVPALILHGEQDALIPTEAADGMAELLGTEAVVLPETGHLPPLEVPAELTAAVSGFLPLGFER
ncbi:MAG TPA: alpha/beta hydrolase [Actinophytocola sp.]|uniref:alpha/beta fold hydrolase n=1 Tax=Actinophytocola sp. TaxID=1872138 RepID=UPI002DDDAC64|nr:alpha/beta hydrolase [Actinophytocola sp.]HEV2782061.1 alpha/beta hydrolase [Actinophytocola sp.]